MSNIQVVQRILAELSGESRDIAFRRVLEEKARDHLIRLLLYEDYDQIKAWYTSDVTMVIGLDATLDAEILKGHDEIVNHFTGLHAETEVLVTPVLTIYDRGRITSYTETYYKWYGKDKKEESPPEAPFIGWPLMSHGDVLKMREVVVFDLNDVMKVKRVEFRRIGMDHLGRVSMDSEAKRSEKIKVLLNGDI